MLYGSLAILFASVCISVNIVLICLIMRNTKYDKRCISNKTASMNRQLTYSLIVQVIVLTTY
jgi:hypothetical protein